MGVRRTRLEFENHYTQIPNAWMRDKRLSRRARGLLAEIMTHRIGWRITIASLQAEGPEGRDAIRTGLQELFELGYLIRSQSQGERGRFKEVEYDLCEPTETAPTAVGKPDTGQTDPGTPKIELSTGSTAVGFTDVGSPAGGPADVGESDTKKNKEPEDQREEHQGGAAAASPASPFCSRHPEGTTRKCRSCGDARRRYDQAQRQPEPEPAPARRSAWKPGLCHDHLQHADTCEMCAREARNAPQTIRAQFGTESTVPNASDLHHAEEPAA